MAAIVVKSLCLLACVVTVTGSAGNVWTYRGSKGPDYWHLDYPHCGGVKQSPINVVTSDVIVDTDRLRPIVFTGYDAVYNVNMTLENNGHTGEFTDDVIDVIVQRQHAVIKCTCDQVKLQVDLNEPFSIISGGGLPGDFVAQQFHFHWGAVDTRGSEHHINDRHFPMEMHIVHFNQKYGDIKHAINKSDGLAVLAFFFEIGRFNRHFEHIIKNFDSIKYKALNVSMPFVPLVQLIPARLSTFYRYEGSLTTPPCYESVTWTIFNETIEIAEEQLERFRTTIFENDKSEGGVNFDISDDYRPPQCMFRRKVYASHEFLKYSDGAVYKFDNPNSASQLALSSQVFAVLITSLLGKWLY